MIDVASDLQDAVINLLQKTLRRNYWYAITISLRPANNLAVEVRNLDPTYKTKICNKIKGLFRRNKFNYQFLEGTFSYDANFILITKETAVNFMTLYKLNILKL